MNSVGVYIDVTASRLSRLGATMVDATLVPSLTILLVLMTGIVEDAEDYTSNVWMLQVLLLAIGSYLALNGYFLWRSGQTLGKKLFGIAIVTYISEAISVDGDKEPVKAKFWKLICVRALFFPLIFMVVTPLAPLPLLDQFMIFGKKRRCLHDLIAGTAVIRLPEH